MNSVFFGDDCFYFVVGDVYVVCCVLLMNGCVEMVCIFGNYWCGDGRFIFVVVNGVYFV